MPNILVVEDELLIAIAMKTQLAQVEQVEEVAVARTLDEARKSFADSKPAIVFLDGDLGRDENKQPITSIPLAREFSQHCSHVISVTSKQELVSELLAAGCENHCEKLDVGHTARQILQAA